MCAPKHGNALKVFASGMECVKYFCIFSFSLSCVHFIFGLHFLFTTGVQHGSDWEPKKILNGAVRKKNKLLIFYGND